MLAHCIKGSEVSEVVSTRWDPLIFFFPDSYEELLELVRVHRLQRVFPLVLVYASRRQRGLDRLLEVLDAVLHHLVSKPLHVAHASIGCRLWPVPLRFSCQDINVVFFTSRPRLRALPASW
jgi:hypothetical protein